MVQDEILKQIAVRTGAFARLEDWRETDLPLGAQALITSIVVVADWLASDSTRFPYTVTPGANRLAAAHLRESLINPWRPKFHEPEADQYFKTRFPQLAGYDPHAVQEEALRVAQQVDAPGLLVIEAPMGQGKTEAALAAAEVLAARFGLGGVFVGLPTMATSNAMFRRVNTWISHLPDEDARSVFLAHGKAALNKDYEVLRAASFTGVGEPDDSTTRPGHR